MLDDAASDEDKIRKLTEVKEDYSALSKDELILFTVKFLEDKNIEPTQDKIAAAAYKLFPKKFALIGFPEYPDSLTVYYSVYHHNTKSKEWLIGNPKSGYKVTDKGKEIIGLIEKKLKESSAPKNGPTKSVPARKEGYFIKEFKNSKVFQKIIKGKSDTILSSDIKNSLGLSSETDLTTTRKVLARYLEYAKRIRDEEAISALNECIKILKGDKIGKN